MRIVGKLVREDVSGGFWKLRSAGGDRVLRGTIPAELSGQQVVVEGEPDEESFGIEMSGPVFIVRNIRAD